MNAQKYTQKSLEAVQTAQSVATEYIHLDKTHGLNRKKAFTDGASWVIDTMCEK